MESTRHGSGNSNGASSAGGQRAKGMRTRLQAKIEAAKEQERLAATGGLSQDQFWSQNVRSAEDIVRFYSLYYPDYPEPLAKAIATRVSGIIEKSRRGDELTEEEKGYVHRSQLPSQTWDPLEELKQQEMAGKVSLAVKRLEDLMQSSV